MEDPTRNYAIPTSAFSIPRYAQGLNGTHSRTNLVDVNSRGSIFKKREFYRNATIVLVAVLILLLLGFIIMTTYYIRAYNALKVAKEICITTDCIRSASNLRLSIDESIDPCQDFYQFTCGKWSDEHPNHGWYPRFSTFSSIDERVSIATLAFLNSNGTQDEPLPIKQCRDFFKSCLDEEATNKLGYSVIIKYLGEVDLPAVPKFFEVNGEDDTFVFDWIKISVNLKKVFAMNLFLQFDIEADMYNRTNYVMYTGSTLTGSPLPSPFNSNRKTIRDKLHKRKSADDDDDDDKNTKSTLEVMELGSKRAIKRIFTEILKNVSEVPSDELLDKAVNMVWNVSSDIAEMANANVTNFENLNIIKYKVDEIQALTDNFLAAKNMEPMEVWKPFLSQLFDGIDNVTFDFDKDYLYLSEPEFSYICEILVYISKTPPLVLELFNWWVVVKSMIVSTTSELSEYIWKETQVYYEQNNDVARSRSLECASLVNGFMGIAVSYGIADKDFMNTTMPKVEQMLNDIKEAFVHRVNEINWMDTQTKKATLEKSKDMISLIGFPEWLLNKTAIEVYYSNLTITPTTYLENMMQFVKAITPYMLKTFHDRNDKTWRTDPTVVNAYNYFADNSINVPMAILTFPLYHLGLEVLNYGAIGSILGHELTHGFDNLGRKYDKEGNYIQWWTNETIKTFEEKTECFVNQYSDYNVSSINMNIDGKLTLGENLADNGGLHHAYLAYQNYLRRFGSEKRLPGFEEYTNNQLFFISYGSIWCETKNDAMTATQIVTDEHCPNEYRVIGTIQNSHEFAEAFKCPVGSNMNPARPRCRIW